MGNCLSPSTDHLAPSLGVKVFTMEELKKATKDFGKKVVIKESLEGVEGVVRGYINPKTLSPAKEGRGITVAVKCCYLPDQALHKWLVDLEFLRLNSHQNLVKLIGYGSDSRNLFLVSEYFANGSLKRHICRESRPKSLPWEIRLKISIGAAQCLAFLHSRKNTGLYRGDLRASKILLDSDFNASVSYFGLQTLASLDDRSHVPSYEDEPDRFHYTPPEYFFSGKLHMAGDVYSFGIILLEILTGLESRRIILAKQAIRNGEGNIAEMIDPDLENTYPLAAGRRICELITQCLEEDPKNRPSMQQVLDDLNVISQL